VHPLKEILREFENRELHGAREVLGYSFPVFPELNGKCSGLRRGEVFTIASPPMRGKVDFLLEMAISAIEESKKIVLFFSYHKSPRDLLYRLLAQKMRMEMEILCFKKIKSISDRKQKLQEALEQFSKFQSYLHIVPGSPKDNVKVIADAVKETKLKYKAKELILIVDSLQRVPVDISYQSEAEKVESVANALKMIALSEDIPVLLSSDVTREAVEVDERENNESVMFKHCKGSSGLFDFTDFAVAVSKNHSDSQELNNQMRMKAEQLGMDTYRLPPAEILDFHMEQSPFDVSYRGIFQFFYFRDTGRLIELGEMIGQELQRFNRIEKVLNQLVERGEIHFKEYDPLASPPPQAGQVSPQASAATNMMTQMMQGAAASQNQESAPKPVKKTPKISLKLGS
jgi:KaiC/GvpD/RAD55 family RecA-like ATPase